MTISLIPVNSRDETRLVVHHLVVRGKGNDKLQLKETMVSPVENVYPNILSIPRRLGLDAPVTPRATMVK
jgi:hypothetical protein